MVTPIRIRHRTAPDPNGCRWCGLLERSHGQAWVPSHGWHAWVEPTDAQRLARMKVRGMLPKATEAIKLGPGTGRINVI